MSQTLLVLVLLKIGRQSDTSFLFCFANPIKRSGTKLNKTNAHYFRNSSKNRANEQLCAQHAVNEILLVLVCPFIGRKKMPLLLLVVLNMFARVLDQL